MLGVSHHTVNSERKVLESTGLKEHRKAIRTTFIHDILEMKPAKHKFRASQANVYCYGESAATPLAIQRFTTAMVINLPFGYQHAPAHPPKFGSE